MANEVTLTAKITATKSAVTVTNATSTKVQTMEAALSAMHHTVQAVGTSKEILSTGDITLTEEHFVLLFNRDATNFVDVYMRLDVTPTDVQSGRMRPGECYGPVRLPAQTAGYPCMYLLANTLACDVEVVVVEAGDPAA